MTVPNKLIFSTFLGGNQWEHARGAYVDLYGNCYVVGGTHSSNYPTVGGNIYQSAYNGGGSDVGTAGDANGFVAKFDRTGTLLWNTLVGGPNYTRCYAVTVDSQGNVYACGRCGMDLATTGGAAQTAFAGSPSNALYGPQNGFVAKFDGSDGSLLWMTYIGTAELCRDIALSPDESYIVVPLGYIGSGNHAGNATECSGWGPAALSGAYQSTPSAGNYNAGLVTISSDGVPIAATYLGGNNDVSQAASVAIDDSGYIYIACYASATNLPVTTGCLSHVSGDDMYVAKFSNDLTTMIWGTYIGGSGIDQLNTHQLAVDNNGGVFVVWYTTSTNIPTTAGAYLETYPAGAANCPGIAKLSESNGNLIACTYFGGTTASNVDGIAVDPSGNLWISGNTAASNNPVTSDAYQGSYGGVEDGWVACFSSDLSTLVYGTFLGGNTGEYIRAMALSPTGRTMLAVGASIGGTYPILNAYQSSYGGATAPTFYSGDNVISMFETPYDDVVDGQASAEAENSNTVGGVTTTTKTVITTYTRTYVKIRP